VTRLQFSCSFVVPLLPAFCSVMTSDTELFLRCTHIAAVVAGFNWLLLSWSYADALIFVTTLMILANSLHMNTDFRLMRMVTSCQHLNSRTSKACSSLRCAASLSGPIETRHARSMHVNGYGHPYLCCCFVVRVSGLSALAIPLRNYNYSA